MRGRPAWTRRDYGGRCRTSPQQVRKAADRRQCVRRQGTAARLPGELKGQAKHEGIIARMRKYVAYCKTPASLLGFSGSKLMSLSLGPGKILVTLENKTNPKARFDGWSETYRKKKNSFMPRTGPKFHTEWVCLMLRSLDICVKP